jgi:hypothetical protein
MSVWDHVSDPEVLARLVQHPNHDRVVRTISELIDELRNTSGRDDLRSVHERLVSATVEAERRYGAARRLMKRGHGDPIDDTFWRRTCPPRRRRGQGRR